MTTRLTTLALLALALTGCRPHDFPQYPPNYREYAYVTNGGSGTVSVLDVVNVRVDRELAVGQNPVAVAASLTRNEVYVVNSGAADGQGTVSVINAENNTVAATINVHHQPVSIEIDPTGGLAYVANSGSNTISVLDLKARREIAAIGAGEEPVAARLSPDGKRPRGLRGLPRRLGCRHPPRFLQSFRGLLGRPPDHGHRPGSCRGSSGSTRQRPNYPRPARPSGGSARRGAGAGAVSAQT